MTCCSSEMLLDVDVSCCCVVFQTVSDAFVLVHNVFFQLRFSCWWSWLTFQDLDNEAVRSPYLLASDQSPALAWLWSGPHSFPPCGPASTTVQRVRQAKVRAVKVGCWKSTGEREVSSEFSLNSLKITLFYAKSDSILLFKKEEREKDPGLQPSEPCVFGAAGSQSTQSVLTRWDTVAK